MTGQFIFPTLKNLALNTQAVLRNTSRQMSAGTDTQVIKVYYKCYKNGQLAFESQAPLEISSGSKLILDESNCPALKNDGVDYLICVKCTKADNSLLYFPQEHQLIYTDAKTGVFTALLYDQIPVQPPEKALSPIILMAPKIWVGENINTYVIFSNANESLVQNTNPIELTILSSDGKIIHTETKAERHNDNWIFDVKHALKNKVEIHSQPTSLTVVAKGGSSSYVITTFIKNEKTGTLALEHSLSPHYYFNGDRNRVRQEALDFTGVSK